jgi:cytochrome P450
MFPRFARASLLDSVRFSLFHVLPMALQGVFRKRPFWVRLVGALHPDPLGRRFVARLRNKYHAPYLDLSMLGRRTRLVLDPGGIREVLERSPDAYAADPRSKREGMSVFQPDAATISRMPEWAARRWFNDRVLTAAVEPPLDDHFLGVVRDEVGQWYARRAGRLAWADLQELFDRITLRVVFGDGAREDRGILAALDTLMARANRVLFRRRSAPAFDALYAGVRKYLDAAGPNCLAGVADHVLRTPGAWPGDVIPPRSTIRPETQVPHWLFAMKDTLAANTAFAIGLLATHPEADDAVRAGFEPGRETTASDLHAADLLEGCVQEGMRLWPTTPMLLREAAAGGVLGGDVHGPGLQVLVWNAANHRDPAVVPDPDSFDPGRWAGRRENWQFNHLSNGRQGCAGKRLALFLAKAVTAELGRRTQLTLVRPRLPPGGPMPETFNWFALVAEPVPPERPSPPPA